MKNRTAQWIAGKLPPRLVYFAFIRLWAHATSTDEGQNMTPDEMNWTKALELWERTHGKV
jgi:hypothetical protein